MNIPQGTARIVTGAGEAAGVVEWPVVLAGGTAPVLRLVTPVRPKGAASEPTAVSTSSRPTAVPSPSSRAKHTTLGKASGSTPSPVPAQPHP
ncbi:hypothetical protein FXW78_46595 [Rhodococcus opacus]|nr:hypothetical protein [Rhodococcus opacus]